ncbi:MAG TPA: hypothetical protein VL025_14400, partial [Thermoanaerobaculia bacterium]|nr:hypothetical protein [Thermoanaerobaculia bacterium]
MNRCHSSRLVLSAIFLFTLVLPARPVGAGLDAWTPIGPYGGSVTVLRYDPVHTGRVYAATLENGVFRSTDGGASWEPMNRGLPPTLRLVEFLVVTPTNPPVLYASAFDSWLFRSVDGAPWEEVEKPLGLYVRPLAGAPSSPDAIWGSCYGGSQGRENELRICKSADGGRTWDTVLALPDNHQVAALVLDPRSPSTLYAAVSGIDPFLLRSRDGGATWERIDGGLPHPRYSWGLSLAVAPDSGHLYFAMEWPDDREPLVFRSTDQGETWSRRGPGGFPVAVGAGGFVVTGSGARSLDDGATWRPGTGLQGRVQSLAANPFAPRRALAGTTLLGVYRTVNGVSPWRLSNQGLIATRALSIAADPAAPGTLYASVRGGGLFKTTTGGGTWQRIEAGVRDALGFLDLEELVVDGASTVYAIQDRLNSQLVDTILRGEDGGTVWTDLRTHGLPYLEPYALAVDPTAPGVLYAGGIGGPCNGLKSNDSGETWACMGTGQIRDITVDPGHPENVYVITRQISRSSNGGESWEAASRGVPRDTARTVAVAPSDSSILYAWAYSKGMLKSTDRGRIWRSVNGNLPPYVEVASVVVHPRNPSIVYVVAGGIYRTTNGGQTWKPLGFGGSVDWNGILILDPEDPR